MRIILIIAQNKIAGKFVITVSKCAPIVLIGVTYDAEWLTEESKWRWSSLAEEIHRNKKVTAIKLCSGDHTFCHKNEPFFNFMIYFQDYF